MAGYWILKTEPTTYSYADLESEGSTRWDGVRNNLALKHIRTMRLGDRAFIYHSGKEKALVGEARIITDPYVDPDAGDPKMYVVDIEAVGALPASVPLAAIKADGAFADLGLVRQGRLSVVPATKVQYDRLCRMARG
jgi:predicted RNA-binding protein with PUA-like domain